MLNPVQENIEFLKYLAGRDLRGVALSDLVCKYQEAQDIFAESVKPDDLLFWGERVRAIEAEINRRDKIVYFPGFNTRGNCF